MNKRKKTVFLNYRKNTRQKKFFGRFTEKSVIKIHFFVNLFLNFYNNREIVWFLLDKKYHVQTLIIAKITIKQYYIIAKYRNCLVILPGYFLCLRCFLSTGKESIITPSLLFIVDHFFFFWFSYKIHLSCVFFYSWNKAGRREILLRVFL